MPGLSLIAASRGSFLAEVLGFLLRRLLLWGMAPRVLRLQQLWGTGLVPRGMWNLPRTGIEPVSPALAGRFLITGPPGKSDTALVLTSPFLINTALCLLTGLPAVSDFFPR